MASNMIVLLSLALVLGVHALPAPVPAEGAETTTAAGSEELLAELEVVELVPVVPLEVEEVEVEAPAAGEAAPAAGEAAHRVVRRSALRGDNPDNDLLAQLDGLGYDSGLAALDGRRIKFLPTWLG